MNPNLDDIYSALLCGQSAAESLMTWQRGSEGYDRAKHYRDACEQGIKAFDLLRAQLRDGKRHIEQVDAEPPTGCYCNATSHPPCSFCTPSEKELDTTEHRRQIGDPRL